MDVLCNSRAIPGPLARRRQPSGSTALIASLLLAACAAPPAPDLSSIEERLRKLDDRITSLERLLTNLPSPPMRSRVEILKNIQSLERRRADLLVRYTPAHPDVREIDLSLRLLRLQIDFLDQAGRVLQ
jgi:hypothetical protein